MPNFVKTGISIGGVHSSSIGVKLVKIGQAGMVPTFIGGGRSVRQKNVSGKDEPWFYRTDMDFGDSLEFTFMLDDCAATPVSWDNLTDRKNIAKWIYGSRGYVDVMSDDDTGKVYKCVFVSSFNFNTASLKDGVFTVTAQTLPHCYTVQSSTPVVVSSVPTVVSVTNEQNVMNADMTYNYYPTLTIVPTGTSFKWTNLSDGNRVFEINPCVPGETITINAKNKIIDGTSSTNLIASLTNKAWPKFVEGTNSIQFNTLGTCTVTTQYPVLR